MAKPAFAILIDNGDYELAGIGPFESEDDAHLFQRRWVPDVHGPVVIELEHPESWRADAH